jgi:hypothetical protein
MVTLLSQAHMTALFVAGTALKSPSSLSCAVTYAGGKREAAGVNV